MKSAQAPFRIITRPMLQEMLARDPRLQLWNVQSHERFQRSENIPGSKWLPLSELRSILPLVDVSKDDEVVIYCGGGDCADSREAARILGESGFSNVFIFTGGLSSWKGSGLPLETIHAPYRKDAPASQAPKPPSAEPTA